MSVGESYLPVMVHISVNLEFWFWPFPTDLVLPDFDKIAFYLSGSVKIIFCSDFAYSFCEVLIVYVSYF